MRLQRRALAALLAVLMLFALLTLFFMPLGEDIESQGRPVNNRKQAPLKRIELAVDFAPAFEQKLSKTAPETAIIDSASTPAITPLPPRKSSIEIVGRVIDSDGAAIDKAQFQFLDSVPPWDFIPSQSSLSKSKKDGSFSLIVKRSELKTHIIASAGPAYEVRALELSAVTEKTKRIALGDIALEGRCVIRGQVVDAFGAGISGASVLYAPAKRLRPIEFLPSLRDDLTMGLPGPGSLRDSKSSISCDEGGYFIIPHLLPGDWMILARHENFCYGPGAKVYLSSGQSVQVQLSLKETASLRFRFQDNAKKPIKGVDVEIYPGAESYVNALDILGGVSNDKGKWSCDRFRLQFFTLLVYKEGYASRVLELDLEKMTKTIQTVTLLKGTIVQGAISLNGNDDKKARIQVLFQPIGASNSSSYADVTYGLKGPLFESSRLNPGKYRVLVTAMSHSVHVTEIELKDHQETFNLGTIALKRLSPVIVKVLNEQNEALDGVRIGATKRGFLFDSLRDFNGLTDANGNTLIYSPPGLVNLYGVKDGYLTRYKDAVLIKESVCRVTIYLTTKAGGRIQGKCYEGSGQLGKTGLIYLARKGHGRLHDSALVNSEGDYFFQKIPEGSYKLIEDPKNSEAILSDPNGWFQVRQGRETRRDFYRKP